MAPVGKSRIDSQRSEQQSSTPAANDDLREAHRRDQSTIDQAHAAERRKLAGSFPDAVGGAREAAGSEGACVQIADRGKVTPARPGAS